MVLSAHKSPRFLKSGTTICSLSKRVVFFNQLQNDHQLVALDGSRWLPHLLTPSGFPQQIIYPLETCHVASWKIPPINLGCPIAMFD